MEKLRWGLIGCGDISQKRVAPALRDLSNCDFLAVNRARFDLAESFAKQYGAKRWYERDVDLFADPDIDAVYIATPVYLHARQTIAASEHGKHVLCEKPMAINLRQCDDMIAACKANNVKLGIAYYRHFYPIIRRIKEVITNKELGSIILVQINAFESFNPQPDEPRYWFVKKEQAGGGPMFDFGCHRIEVMMNLFGSIIAVHGAIYKVLYKREVEDTAYAVFQFEGGLRGILTVTHAAYESQDTLDIFGSKGSIHVSVLNHGDMTVKTSGGERTEMFVPPANFHQPLIDNFTRAILLDRDPLVPGETGREVNRILDLIYQS